MTGAACVPALKALGDQNRLRILRLLSKAPRSVREISTRLGLAEYNVSKHLRILREAGLLECRRLGKQRHYTIPSRLHPSVKARNGILDLGCCTFRFDRLPR